MSIIDITVFLINEGLVCCQGGYRVSGSSRHFECDVGVLIVVTGVGTANRASLWGFDSSIYIWWYLATDGLPILSTAWL